MIVITVARKPVEGTVSGNVLKHGTGSLNIDASRIGGFQNTTPSGANRFNASLAAQGYRPDAYEQPVTPPQGAVGRWPANVIFEHKPDCKQTGTRDDAYTIQTWDEGAQPFGGASGKPFTSAPVPTLKVPVWSCVESCPVAELDRQSGESLSAGGVNAGTLGKRIFGKYSGDTIGETAGGFGDSGGASRYYKCVGGQKS